MVRRKSRKLPPIEAAHAVDPDLADALGAGLFGFLRVALWRLILRTKRAPEPIRRALWGQRPDPTDRNGPPKQVR